MESVPPGNSGPAPTADGVLPPLPESRPESVGTTTARARPPPPVFTRPTISVQVSLPQGGRYSRARSRGGLKLRLTATLVGAEAGAVSLLRRGTIFDGACPLLGRGGFWGVADAQRRPVRIEHDPDADGATKRCTRTHVRAGEGFLAFEDKCVPPPPPPSSLSRRTVLIEREKLHDAAAKPAAVLREAHTRRRPRRPARRRPLHAVLAPRSREEAARHGAVQVRRARRHRRVRRLARRRGCGCGCG